MAIAKHPVRMILVDNKSSADILFYNTFVQMDLPINQLKPVSIPLVAFNRESIGVEKEITLPIMARIPSLQSTIFIAFTMVRVLSTYNAIIKRPEMS